MGELLDSAKLELERFDKLSYANSLLLVEHIAELEAALKEREWQPLETAPKDGSWFLATWKFRDFFKCRHVTAEILASENGGLPSDWVDECWDDGDDEVDPTHWMPLREPSRALDAQENSDE